VALTVVLAVALDSSLLRNQSSVWRAAGYMVTSAGSIREAIGHFKAGDFDLVLLGDSISIEDRERLSFLIRASGSLTPIVCVAKSSGACDSFADATLKNDASELLIGMGALLANKARMRRCGESCTAM
jgi:DNA-binding response OmpR family regulator